jgi:hypothetical protein
MLAFQSSSEDDNEALERKLREKALESMKRKKKAEQSDDSDSD